ncbi:putative P-loop containing nucleoside triphosphate hydrolase [Helianthus anomalus]
MLTLVCVHDSWRTMADALGHRLEKLIKLFDTIVLSDEDEVDDEADSVITMKESLDDLMIYLRDMMAGYENEQVLALLKQMEDLVASNLWHEYRMIVTCEQLCNIRYSPSVEEEKAVVGFDNEIEALLDQLTGTCSTKQFHIISITGMAGLGKTVGNRTC